MRRFWLPLATLNFLLKHGKFTYMNHPYNKQKTRAVWDYDIKTADFSDPWVMRWSLSRRINYADWRGLRKADIKKHLEHLDVESGIKKLLQIVINKKFKKSSCGSTSYHKKICKQHLNLITEKVFKLYNRADPKALIDMLHLEENCINQLLAITKRVSKNLGVGLDHSHLAARALEASERLNEIKPFIDKKVNIKKLQSEIENLFSSSGKKYLSNLLV